MGIEQRDITSNSGETFNSSAEGPSKNIIDQINELDPERKEKAREWFLATLEQHNFIKRTEKDIWLDTAKISQAKSPQGRVSTWLDMIDKTNSYRKINTRLGENLIHNKLDMLLFAFGDRPIKDLAHPEEPAKPLFWTPKDPQDLTLENIRNAKFTLPINYLPLALRSENPNYQSLFESQLALVIFHPDYGDAKRDNTGKLLLRHPTTRLYSPFSSNNLVKQYRFSHLLNPDQMSGSSSPIVKLEKLCPNLVANGLLKSDDFRYYTQPTHTELREWHERMEETKYVIHQSRYHMRHVPNNGSVEFGNNKYHFGRPHGRDHYVVPLDDKVGALVIPDENGKLQISRLFDIAPPAPQSEYRYIGRNKMNFRPYDPTEFVKKRADETPEAYQNRLDSLHSFELRVKFFENLASHTGLSFTQFSGREQTLITLAISQLSEKERGQVVEQAKVFGAPLVRSFMASELGDHYGKRILEIGQMLPENQARQVYEDFSASIEAASAFSRNLGKDLEPAMRDQFYLGVLRHGTEIIAALHAKATNPNQPVQAMYYGGKILEINDVSEAIEALQHYRSLVEMTADFLSDPEKRSNYQFTHLYENDQSESHSSHYLVRHLATANESHFIFQSRSFGTHQPNQEMEFDGEARINFLHIPEPANLRSVSDQIADPERSGALSLRLDREGKTRHGAIITGNDPTSPEGVLSLEIGSIDPRSTDPNAKLGRIISIGNAIVAGIEHPGQVPSFYHNRDALDTSLSNNQTFANWVQSLRQRTKH